MSNNMKDAYLNSSSDEEDDVPDLLPLHFIHDEVYILVAASDDQSTNYSIFYNSG